MTFTCGTCWRQFPAGWQSREQHLTATGHQEPSFECNVCDRYFGSERAMHQHMDDVGHWGNPVFECDDCSSTFSDEDDLRDHEVGVHFYCDPCDRYFQNRNNIMAHRNSKIHRTSNLACPFCGKTDVTATGLIHHLERGACPRAPLDRKKVYDEIRRRDPNGLLTKNLLTYPSSDSYEATSMAYNPAEDAFECYFCHRLFQSLQSLNQHLASPVHQQDLYHCPNGRCRKGFTTLAAVINHLESESCQYMRFDAVQKTATQIMDPRRMISF